MLFYLFIYNISLTYYNYNIWSYALYVANINILLDNILFIYHPPALYAYLVTILLFFKYGLFVFYARRAYLNIAPSLLALFLFIGTFSCSAWWAYQVGTWGGWWGWDMSEYLLLLWGYNLYIYMHNILTWFKYIIEYFFFLNILYYIYAYAQFFLLHTAHTFLNWAQLLHIYHLCQLSWYAYIICFIYQYYFYYVYSQFFIYYTSATLITYWRYYYIYILLLFTLTPATILQHHITYIYILIIIWHLYRRWLVHFAKIHIWIGYIYIIEQCGAHEFNFWSPALINNYHHVELTITTTYFFTLFLCCFL